MPSRIAPLTGALALLIPAPLIAQDTPPPSAAAERTDSPRSELVFVEQIDSGNLSSVSLQNPQATNFAQIKQDGTELTAQITQSGELNSAVISQSGTLNHSVIVQQGRSNTASTTQIGSGHSSTITQSGTGNIATVTQN